MKTSQTNEIGRKAIHYTASLIPLLYYFFFNRYEAVIIMAILTVGITIGEMLRMKVPFFRSIYLDIFGSVIRSHEQLNHFTGATFVFWGGLLTIWSFPKPIATTALLFLTVGDSSACLVGMMIGRIKLINSRTLEGVIAFIVASLIMTWWIPDLAFEIKVVGAVTGSLVELVHRRVDDNLLIPLFSGVVMYMLTHLPAYSL